MLTRLKQEGPRKRQLVLEFPRLNSTKVETPVKEIPDRIQPTISFETRTSITLSEVFTPDEGSLPRSNDTSLMEEDGPPSKSQDYLPTQDAIEFMEDPSFTESLDGPESGTPEPTPKLSYLEELRTYGPFRPKQTHLPPDLHFWYRYELSRVGSKLPKDEGELCRLITTSCRTQRPDFNTFWQAIAPLRSSKNLLEKSRLQDWTIDQACYEDESTSQSVQFSGQLSWSSATDSSLFKFSLNPLNFDTSCRAHRRFGADRFMVISLPYFSGTCLPKDSRNLSRDVAAIEKSVNGWLTTTVHEIAGRKWRAWFIEPDKKKSQAKKDSAPTQKLHLFAVDGHGFKKRAPFSTPLPTHQPGDEHQQISLEEFLNWHIPIDQNRKSTDLKAFSRFALALSKTKPTVVLEQYEFIHLADTDPVMNDGCALMSYPLARRISELLGLSKKREYHVPSVFQGRIGGAKGLWMVDSENKYPNLSPRGYWIEVTDSQLKIKPHPKDRKDADPEQRQFEVLKYPKACKPTRLNHQLLAILYDRGVPRQVLQETLLDDIRTYSESLFEAMKDPQDLRAWVQTNHRVPRTRRLMEFSGGLPKEKEEQVNLLLESGFVPNECQILNEKLCSFLQDEMKRYIEKLQILVPRSTYVLAMADPYSVLEEHEIHLGFSENWDDPETGRAENGLYDTDVLVSRLPAHLASDIQKRKAVYKQQLRHFKDVVVFPTKGDVPLASLLSGGDYDGDTMWVCWEPAIVKKFKNVDMPKLPTASECGLINISIPLERIFRAPCITPDEVNSFLRSSFSFNSKPSLLGTCTIEHEKLIYHQRHQSLSTPEAVKLAALAGYLVDAAKQGYSLTETKWHELRRSTSGIKKLDMPAYRAGGEPRRSKGKHAAAENIVDFLKFDIAEKESLKVLAEFAKQWDPKKACYDPDLKSMYSDLWSKAEKNRKAELFQLLNKLRHDVKAAADVWKAKAREDNKESFRLMVELIHEQVSTIVPDIQVEHDIVRRFKEEEGRDDSFWARLRASCVYYFNNKGSMVWYAVGNDLCMLKVQAQGPTRTMSAKMHSIMKVDTKLQRKFHIDEAKDEGDDDDDDDGSSIGLNLLENWVAYE